MRIFTMPKFIFQADRQPGDDDWHSIVISVARGLAALIVAAAHLRAEMYPGLRTLSDPSLWFQGFAFVTGFAHQAVLVFFVVSGWLVGGSLLNKIDQPGAVSNYAIDRVTRLWTVLIPTFVLTLVFGFAVGQLQPGSLDFSVANDYSAATFAGNLFGLQDVVLDEFGGNYALWSLANETWYYVMFPLLVIAFTARRRVLRLACGAALTLAVVVLPEAIVMYSLVWLLGVAFSRIRIDCSAGLRWAWLVPLLAASAYFRLTADNDRFDQATLGMDLLLGLMFLALLSSLRFRAAPTSTLARPIASFGKFFADFSFSLYVLHLPLIFLLKHLVQTELELAQLSPSEPAHFAIYLGMLSIVLLGAHLSSLLFEARTYQIRRVAKDLLMRRAVPLTRSPKHTPDGGAPDGTPGTR